jgi:hypothetical protein
MRQAGRAPESALEDRSRTFPLRLVWVALIVTVTCGVATALLWLLAPKATAEQDRAAVSGTTPSRAPVESRARRFPGADRRTNRFAPYVAEPTELDARERVPQRTVDQALECIEEGSRTVPELATCWAREERDDEWSANVEGYVYAALELQDLDADVVREVDCRQALCRIELDGADMAPVLRLGANRVNKESIAYDLVTSDGGRRVVAYITRDELAGRVFNARRTEGAEAGPAPRGDPLDGGGVHR